jgi:hypothetical protein
MELKLVGFYDTGRVFGPGEAVRLTTVGLHRSGGAEVELDGQMQDLAPYRHSNVAHFKAFAAGQPISAY